MTSSRRAAKLNKRLPRGRHGLPREAVTESQRNRIHQAMIEVVSARGYPETRVVDVIGVAGVSRKTFYELFESKEDCFLAAYDVLLGNLLGEATDVFESKPGAPWAERVAAALDALLVHLARAPRRGALRDRRGPRRRSQGARPAATRPCGSSPASSSPVARRPRSSCRGSPRSRSPAASTSCSTARSCTAPSARLPSRLPDLMFWVALPFLGRRCRRRRARARAAGEAPLASRWAIRSFCRDPTGLRIGRGW